MRRRLPRHSRVAAILIFILSSSVSAATTAEAPESKIPVLEAEKSIWTEQPAVWASGFIVLISLAVLAGWRHSSLKSINRRLQESIQEKENAYIALKKTESAQQHASALMEEAQALAHIGTWELDPNTMKAVWSDEVYRIFGIEADGDDAGPERLSTLLHPVDRDDVISSLNRAVRDGAKHQMEYRVVRPDGDTRWISCQAEQVSIPDSELFGLRGFVQDITERKRSEDALRESELRNSLIVEGANVAVWDWNLKTDVTEWNANLRDLFGHSAGLVQNSKQWWLERIHPDDFPLVEESITSHIAGGEGTWREEYRFKHLDGRWRHIIDWGVIVKSEIGEPARMVGAMMDITERKQAEAALRESEAKFRSLVESSSDWIWAVNAKGFYTYASPRVEAILGYTPEEIIGKTPFDLMPPGEAERIEKAFQSAVKERKPLVSLENVNLHKDGRRIVLETSGVPFFDDARQLVGYRGIDRDVTDRKHTEEALDRAQKMEAIGQLSGGIAHDFNNILGIILGNLDLLRIEIPDNDGALERVETIQKSARRAAKLTRKLLAVSRREAAQAQAIDINRMIGDMETLITRSVTPAILVENRLAEGLWLTRVDPGDLEDALLNLVMNARDAMPGGGNLTLETSNVELDAAYCEKNPNTRPGEYVQLAVSDNGKGISPEHRAHIFDPFFTTKPKDKGTGLGLAMVYGFAKRSGGDIKVYSEPGIGTTFRLYIPKADAGDKTLSSIDEHPEALPRGQETILVVDDEPDLAELAESSLRELGYQVLTANDGPRALALLAREPDIHLLFSDVVMPGGMNGYELAKQATGNHPALKVLLTSGYTDEAAVSNGQARFSASLLPKPYSLAELAKKVRILLDEANCKPPATLLGPTDLQ